MLDEGDPAIGPAVFRMSVCTARVRGCEFADSRHLGRPRVVCRYHVLIILIQGACISCFSIPERGIERLHVHMKPPLHVFDEVFYSSLA